MTAEQASIDPILREIDNLVERIRRAELAQSAEYQRTKALMTLDGVAQILKAFCLAPQGNEGYWYYQFGQSGT